MVKMPFEIHDEIVRGKGELKNWITDARVKNSLVLEEEVDQRIFNRVIQEAYAPDLTDGEFQKIGRDPFLVAYGLMEPNRSIVTKEISKPKRIRGNRKLPDVCKDMNVPCMTDFEVYREQNFYIP